MINWGMVSSWWEIGSIFYLGQRSITRSIFVFCQFFQLSRSCFNIFDPVFFHCVGKKKSFHKSVLRFWIRLTVFKISESKTRLEIKVRQIQRLRWQKYRKFPQDSESETGIEIRLPVQILLRFEISKIDISTSHVKSIGKIKIMNWTISDADWKRKMFYDNIWLTRSRKVKII